MWVRFNHWLKTPEFAGERLDATAILATIPSQAVAAVTALVAVEAVEAVDAIDGAANALLTTTVGAVTNALLIQVTRKLRFTLTKASH